MAPTMGVLGVSNNLLGTEEPSAELSPPALVRFPSRESKGRGMGGVCVAYPLHAVGRKEGVKLARGAARAGGRGVYA